MKVCKIIVMLIFILFFCTVLLSISGYYQTELQKKMILTNEAIKSFEQDLSEGKEVDVNDYLKLNQKDYENFFTKSGRFVSKKINDLVSTGIEKTLKIIIKAIED